MERYRLGERQEFGERMYEVNKRIYENWGWDENNIVTMCLCFQKDIAENICRILEDYNQKVNDNVK